MITLARALLRLALPRDDRDDVLDDLDEEFARIRGERTRSGAILWFIWQALGSIPFAIALRMRRARSLRGPRAAAPWPASGLPHDLRSAARALGRHRAFTTSAVLTLALGMAVSTSIASIADALLRRPLPYQDPDRLVCLFEVDPLRPDHRRGLSYPDLLDLERAAGTKLSMAGFSGGSRTVTGDGPAERIAIVEVTSGFFATLGVEPLVGRDFRGLTATAVVMLSHRMWERRFARDPLVVGRTMTLNGRPHEIVGVLPASFEFPLRGLADLFVPLVPSPAQADRRYWHWLDVVAPSGSFVVNIGDMMQYWTNDAWHSTVHRVVNPPSQSKSTRRQSLVFFHTPNENTLIECLPGCCSADNPPRYAPILAGEHMRQKSEKAGTLAKDK